MQEGGERSLSFETITPSRFDTLPYDCKWCPGDHAFTNILVTSRMGLYCTKQRQYHQIFKTNRTFWSRLEVSPFDHKVSFKTIETISYIFQMHPFRKSSKRMANIKQE